MYKHEDLNLANIFLVISFKKKIFRLRLDSNFLIMNFPWSVGTQLSFLLNTLLYNFKQITYYEIVRVFKVQIYELYLTLYTIYWKYFVFLITYHRKLILIKVINWNINYFCMYSYQTGPFNDVVKCFICSKYSKS